MVITEIEINQGASWFLVFNLKELNGILPLNLTNYTVAAQIRETRDSTVILATPTATFTTPRTSGILTLSLTPIQTGALNFYDAYYNVLLTDNLNVTVNIQHGRVLLIKSVTR